MKILLSNKYYYLRGGDCIYTIELQKLLMEQGHEVAVFSMQHPFNHPSAYSRYFPGEVDFHIINIKSFISLCIRPFGSPEVRRNFKRLINDFNPDIVHINNIHSQLSPVLASIAHKRKIPVVWTLHDYKLVCPAYLFLSNKKICEACLTNKVSVIKKRCIKHSFFAGIIAYIESLIWNHTKLSKVTGKFIAPSNFLKEKVVMGGFRSERIKVLYNFVNSTKFTLADRADGNYYCYVGRISFEKGVETLLKAASGLPEYTLKLIGSGPLEKELKAKYKSINIEFLGYKCWDELKYILASSKFLVLPSVWYENSPLCLIESLCLGTPVIGAKIGGIPELIDPGVNGLLFESGNVADLQEKITYLWKNSSGLNRSEIASAARLKHKSADYYEKLLKIYSELVNA